MTRRIAVADLINPRVELNWETTMSKRNGDKARYGREQQRKIRLRQNTREVRRVLLAKAPSAATPSPAERLPVVDAGQAEQPPAV